MDHVNNAVYADWLDEAVIAAGDVAGDAGRPAPGPAGVRASPPSAARPSRPRPGATDDGWSCRLADADGDGAAPRAAGDPRERRRPRRSRASGSGCGRSSRTTGRGCATILAEPSVARWWTPGLARSPRRRVARGGRGHDRLRDRGRRARRREPPVSSRSRATTIGTRRSTCSSTRPTRTRGSARRRSGPSRDTCSTSAATTA